jgi:hypothetical protein
MGTNVFVSARMTISTHLLTHAAVLTATGRANLDIVCDRQVKYGRFAIADQMNLSQCNSDVSVISWGAVRGLRILLPPEGLCPCPLFEAKFDRDFSDIRNRMRYFVALLLLLPVRVMGLVFGSAMFGVAASIVWFLRSPDGVHSHPLVERAGMGVLIGMTCVTLFAAGMGFIFSWLAQ